MGVAFSGLVFFLGASLGSFVNVVAFRVPYGRSIVRPGSRCPACATPIRWYANVPVLGWFIVRGRCQACRVPISARYPLVELVAGLVALALWRDIAIGLDAARHALPSVEVLGRVVVPFVLETTLAMTLIALALMDLDWFLLPDVITLPLAGLGLLAALGDPRGPGFEGALLGAAIGGLGPWLLMRLYGAATGRTGLGGGDWKLLLGIGAWLGVTSLPFVLGAGAVQGLVAALLFRRDFARVALPRLPGEEGAEAASQVPSAPDAAVPFRRLMVPFGPFLAVAALEWLLFRDEISRWFAR